MHKRKSVKQSVAKSATTDVGTIAPRKRTTRFGSAASASASASASAASASADITMPSKPASASTPSWKRESERRNLLSNFTVDSIMISTSVDGVKWNNKLPSTSTERKDGSLGRLYTLEMPKDDVQYRVEGRITSPIAHEFAITMKLGATSVKGVFCNLKTAGTKSFVIDGYLDQASLKWSYESPPDTAVIAEDPDMNVINLTIVPCKWVNASSDDPEVTRSVDLGSAGGCGGGSVDFKLPATTEGVRFPVGSTSFAQTAHNPGRAIRAMKHQSAASSVTGDISISSGSKSCANAYSVTADVYAPPLAKAHQRVAIASALDAGSGSGAAASAESGSESYTSDTTSFDLSACALSTSVMRPPAPKIGIAGRGPIVRSAGVIAAECKPLPVQYFDAIPGIRPKFITISLLQAK